MGLPELAVPVMAIDLGTINVKVSYFDAVSGQYSLIAAAQATGGPYSRDFDFYTPVFQAIKSIESQTGRILLDPIGRIIAPINRANQGVGKVVITGSTGPEVRVMLVGLLPEVSLESATRLVELNYGQIVHQVGLHNQLPVEQQVDASTRAKPDIILLCGGSDHGGQKTPLQNIELVRLFCSLLPEYERPKVLYAGSQAFAQTASEVLSKLTKTRTAPNLRPHLEGESLDPAQRVMQEFAAEYRQGQSETLGYFGKFFENAPSSAAHSFGRTVRFLSKLPEGEPGVIGINIGAETTTIASSKNGGLNLRVLPYGMGERITAVADGETLAGIRQWLPPRFSNNKVRDYLWQKSLYPGSIPADTDSLAIEQAAAREIIRLSCEELDEDTSSPQKTYGIIVAGGSVLADAPSLGQSLLMLLDGLEPVGVCSVFLDPYSIMASMGAAAPVDPVLAVQVLDSFLSEGLATVISPVSWAPRGTTIMTVQVDDGGEVQPVLRIKKGEIMRLPIPAGKVVLLHLKMGIHTFLDPARRLRSANLQVKGGMLGVVIDGRGRPVNLPISATGRWKLNHKWADSIEG